MAVGGLSEGFTVTLNGAAFPSAVTIDMLQTAPASHKIRVFRKIGSINPGDTGVEYADFSCDEGGGSVSAICDADSGPSLVDGGTGYLKEEFFTGVGQVPGGAVSAPAPISRPQVSVASHPNPAILPMTIRYTVPVAGRVTLRAFDASGRLVCEIVNKYVEPGSYSAKWNGRDIEGRSSHSGVFFLRLSTMAGNAVSRTILIR
jgi:hypothetical protein